MILPVDVHLTGLIRLSVVFLGEVLTWKTAIGALLITGGTLVLYP